MKRTIEFSFQENEYYLQEDETRIFAIKASDLKFDSVEFYNGVYKNTTLQLFPCSDRLT